MLDVGQPATTPSPVTRQMASKCKGSLNYSGNKLISNGKAVTETTQNLVPL